MLTGVKAVIFDLGGVLIDLDKKACISAFNQLGYANAADLLDAYHQKGVFKELEEGKISSAQFRTFVKGEIGKEIDDKMIDNALIQFLQTIPVYKLDLLLELRKHYKVYMLSNTNEIMFDYICQKEFTKQGLVLDDYFDRCFVSYKMGYIKPHAAIYEQMIAAIGLPVEELFFFDDGVANIEAAAALGIRGYLTKEREDFRFLFETAK